MIRVIFILVLLCGSADAARQRTIRSISPAECSQLVYWYGIAPATVTYHALKRGYTLMQMHSALRYCKRV
jgi:hypothetical protein